MPNIILILTDDQGYGDIAIHGNNVIQTPNLDKFAGQSTEFNQFYCSPVCAPTRASLLTGRYNYRTGIVHTSRGGAKMASDEITIAEILSENGYNTAIFGKWHLGDNFPMRPSDQGFKGYFLIHLSGGIGQAPDIPNSYFDPELWHNNEAKHYNGYCTDIFTDAAIQFIGDNRDSPFFVYLSYNAPHLPLAVPDQYRIPYEAMGLDSDVARLYAMVTNIDANLGRLLDMIEKWQLAEETIIIFLSDNGPGGPERFNAGLRGRKGNTYEGGIRVPCFVRWPGRFNAGTKIHEIAAHIDIPPTLLAAIGLEKSAEVTFDGMNLLPLLQDEPSNWPDRSLYFQFNRGMIPRRYQNCAVRTPRYKMVAVYGSAGEIGPEQLPLPPGFELYDMMTDPQEKNNIASEKPEIVKQLLSSYENWYDDMEASRYFEPGLIEIGDEIVNPVRLCRYQDASYVNGLPAGWPVRILRNGRYAISIRRYGYNNKARIFVRFNDLSVDKLLFPGENRAVFDLPAGTGMLNVWFEEDDTERITFTANHTIGDIELEYLRDCE